MKEKWVSTFWDHIFGFSAICSRNKHYLIQNLVSRSRALETTEPKISTCLNGGGRKAKIKDSDIVLPKLCCPCYWSGETFYPSVAYCTLEIRPRAGQSWSVWKMVGQLKLMVCASLFLLLSTESYRKERHSYEELITISTDGEEHYFT